MMQDNPRWFTIREMRIRANPLGHKIAMQIVKATDANKIMTRMTR